MPSAVPISWSFASSTRRSSQLWRSAVPGMVRSLVDGDASSAYGSITYPLGAIEIRGLVVDRGRRRVLDGLSLDVTPGRITGLLGPSGSGKTTLMRCIVGVQ